MHKSRLGCIIIDCNTGDLDAAARFWSQALGVTCESATDPGDIYRALEMPASEPRVLVQQVTHPSRVHLDIETDDIEAEVKRLEALGARRIEFIKRWWVMEAPTGHRFCVLPKQRKEFGPHLNEWP